MPTAEARVRSGAILFEISGELVGIRTDNAVYASVFPYQYHSTSAIGKLKCEGTRAETRIRLSAKRTSRFKSAGTSVQSTTGSRGVPISGSNAGYTMCPRYCEGYWLPTPFASFPFTSPPVRHRVPSHFNWSLPPTVRDLSQGRLQIQGKQSLADAAHFQGRHVSHCFFAKIQ